MKSSSVTRIRLLSGVVILAVIILLSKLWSLQVIKGDDFRIRAERQYLHPTDSTWNRGSIFFGSRDNTTIAAATLKTGYILAINPKILENSEVAYKKVNDLYKIDKDNFITKSADKTLQYVGLAKKLDEDVAKKIGSLKIPGVMIYSDRYRYYPYGPVASNVIGLVGYKGDVLAGRYGLESYYDDTLTRDGDNVYSNFFAEIFSNLKKSVDPKAKFEGDIVTSIEPTTQSFLQEQLRAILEKWNSKASGGIIMDPKTGEIFAMGNYPTFDPNDFQNESNPYIFSNPMVENVYEMGSIIKPLTMAAGIDSGVVTADTTYDDKGFLILNGSKISNFDGKARGKATMQQVLNESLNTGVSFVAQKMGNNLFSEYFKKYGFGEETGIDLPNETPGIISNLDSPREIERATASFGQGIAMSPIITIRALSSLANGGYLVTPHIVNKIEYRSGISKNISYPKGAQVIKPETSEEITRMLTTVVDKALLGGTVKMDHYSIAAKTGTAQIAKEGGGGYYSDKYLHSFFGYFPSYNPKFIIFLYTLEPKGVGGDFASHTLTAPFMEIVKFLINYYKIPPDR